MPDAIGFYWTLPVPWAGFTALSADVDEAAKQSRTIRYQRDLIRHYAKDNGLTLVHEAVFLEIEPDRGSKAIMDGLRKVAPIARKHGAQVLVVDFAAVQNWRGHQPLHEIAATLNLRLQSVYPDEIAQGPDTFDPSAHFADWRRRQAEWSAGKSARLGAALARAAELRAQGASFAKSAAALNAEGLQSPSGKQWSADNLRKAMAPKT
ncbi:MAG: hypothetical protein Q8K20_07635 [Gemmobacter sp.]|nr:hypothetical protein [Gemmobacter sp.]